MEFRFEFIGVFRFIFCRLVQRLVWHGQRSNHKIGRLGVITMLTDECNNTVDCSVDKTFAGSIVMYTRFQSLFVPLNIYPIVFETLNYTVRIMYSYVLSMWLLLIYMYIYIYWTSFSFFANTGVSSVLKLILLEYFHRFPREYRYIHYLQLLLL